MDRSPPTALLALLLLLPLMLPSPSEAARSRDLQQAMYEVQDRALSALVNIQPITETFNRGETRKQSSIGSGFLIDDQGHIVTNYHVAGQAKQLMVTLSNKERLEAVLIGEDPLTDLAVIKIPAEKVAEYGLKPLSFGSSSALQVGQFVMAFGSPLALARTMTFGIVSNTERYLPEGMSLPSGERTGEFNTWIQTDAAINPGNSGGPLINLDGEVVGVNARGAVFADNIGFAIPADTATKVVADLITGGEVHRGYAGAHFQALKDWEELFDLEVPRGVLVASIEPGSPAAASGLVAGDVVTRLGSWEGTVRFDEELPAVYQLIADLPIGEEAPVEVIRLGSPDVIELTLSTVETGRLQGDRFEATHWGFTVKGITDQMVFDFELPTKDGVLVEGVRTGGPAALGELSRGVIIVSIADRPVTDLDGFKALYAELTTGERPDVLLHTQHWEAHFLVLVRPGEATSDEGGSR